jgi:hypothetical protein
MTIIVFRGSKTNAGLVEALLHRRFMHLTRGRNRLWSKIGAGDTTGAARGTHEVYITFSLDAAYHLDVGNIVCKHASEQLLISRHLASGVLLSCHSTKGP